MSIKAKGVGMERAGSHPQPEVAALLHSNETPLAPPQACATPASGSRAGGHIGESLVQSELLHNTD